MEFALVFGPLMIAFKGCKFRVKIFTFLERKSIFGKIYLKSEVVWVWGYEIYIVALRSDGVINLLRLTQFEIEDGLENVHDEYWVKPRIFKLRNISRQSDILYRNG